MTQRRYPPVNLTLYRTAQHVIRFLAAALIREVIVEGQEHIPKSGPFLMATNHLSFLDSPIMFMSMPRILYLLAGERYQRHAFGPILRIAGAIFVRRGEIDREALRQALAALEDGYALAVAVEGTRSRTGGLIEGKTGAAYLATRAGVPILPAVMWGTEQIGPSWKRLRRGGPAHVRFGPLIRLPDGRARSADLEYHTDEIMTTLAALLPEAYRGVYRDHPALAAKLKAAAAAS
jgi:1-acyl-sn-glycerol-3-phosphate acyltransferase